MILFDGLLISVILWLAWRSLASPDLFKGVVLFISFGLVVALAWVRLNAPDIALVEVAISSGLTGALFLTTLGRLKRMNQAAGQEGGFLVDPTAGKRTRWIFRGGTAVFLTSMAALLILAALTLPVKPTGLSDLVQERIEESGASNPVTAVLLNFRAYDTFLEVAVLLLGVIAAWSLVKAERRDDGLPVHHAQTALCNLLAPVMLVIAGYLMWIGSSQPGGAFQAGAVLGGAGVLLILSNPGLPGLRDGWGLRGLLALGTAGFMLIGLCSMIPDRLLFQYPLEWAGPLIILIESLAMVSIGAALAILFVGGRLPENFK